MNVVVKIKENIKAADVVKKVMAGKHAFGEAVRTGNFESFVKQNPTPKRKAIPANKLS